MFILEICWLILSNFCPSWKNDFQRDKLSPRETPQTLTIDQISFWYINLDNVLQYLVHWGWIWAPSQDQSLHFSGFGLILVISIYFLRKFWSGRPPSALQLIECHTGISISTILTMSSSSRMYMEHLGWTKPSFCRYLANLGNTYLVFENIFGLGDLPKPHNWPNAILVYPSHLSMTILRSLGMYLEPSNLYQILIYVILRWFWADFGLF